MFAELPKSQEQLRSTSDKTRKEFRLIYISSVHFTASPPRLIETKRFSGNLFRRQDFSSSND